MKINKNLLCSCRCGPVAQGRADVVDHALDQALIVALGHHADHWFGARRTDEQSPALAKPCLALRDCSFHCGGGKRVASRVDTGMMFINNIDWSDAELPFGGIKNSGYGRELGDMGIQQFVNKKLVRTANERAPT